MCQCLRLQSWLLYEPSRVFFTFFFFGASSIGKWRGPSNLKDRSTEQRKFFGWALCDVRRARLDGTCHTNELDSFLLILFRCILNIDLDIDRYLSTCDMIVAANDYAGDGASEVVWFVRIQMMLIAGGILSKIIVRMASCMQIVYRKCYRICLLISVPKLRR